MDLSGVELARAYHAQVVGPLLARRFPGMPYAAALLGSGSEVLGLDDAVSRDHDWGPRLTLLVPEGDVGRVERAVEQYLPGSFLGLPTRFALSGETTDQHRVEVSSTGGFVRARLGLDPRGGMAAADWLTLTGQAVLEVVAGPVFVDTAGEVTTVRRLLGSYPEDVRRHLVAVDWARIGEEMPLMSRSGDRGDDLGSRVIAARLVDAAVHLAFLLEGRWVPYPKWRGLVLGELPHTGEVVATLGGTMTAPAWRERQDALARALGALMDRQAASGLPTVGPAVVPFWDRPYLHPDPRVVDRVRACVVDPAVRAWPVRRGSAEQLATDVGLLGDPRARRRLVELTDGGLDGPGR
ncbi:DUF4037 domain-containing protein [Ornithinimicrobium cerasi]|uniref:DUF4037 domain-containing protein n=1 Tax=Ornithinimicrobium cerasi TaxID=2248773 RepID=A0A285VSM0_9MICO|nr:DUF4037 domain-containing protein [Ornithinimicrobium cerasi]SOC56867.1 protein of unknown function [Ornithinimicrobium cerasi]